MIKQIKKELKILNLNQIIVDKNQPRKNFEGIGELANNINKHGLLQPLKVRYRKDKYFLINGERRLRALNLLRRKKVECIVAKENKNNTFLLQVCDDFHKQKLNLIEQADSIEKLRNEGYSTEDICHNLGIRKTAFYSRLKILKLSPRSKKYILDGKINLNDLHNLSNLDLADEERVIKRIVEDKPRTEREVRRIILEETDLNYMINEYSSNVFRFNKVLEDFDSKLVLFKSYLTEEKKQMIKQNDNVLMDEIKKCIDSLKELRVKIEFQEKNFV